MFVKRAGGRAMTVLMAGALVAAGVAVAPAFGAAERAQPARRITSATPRFTGSFTRPRPTRDSPRRSRAGPRRHGLPLHPAEARQDKRAVTVAVRVRSNRVALADAARTTAPAPTVGIQPIAYKPRRIGGLEALCGLGWINHIDLGPVPGSRESTDVALTYRAGRASSRVMAGLRSSARHHAEADAGTVELFGRRQQLLFADPQPRSDRGHALPLGSRPPDPPRRYAARQPVGLRGHRLPLLIARVGAGVT